MGYGDPRHQLRVRQTQGGLEPGLSPVWMLSPEGRISASLILREDCSPAQTTSLLNWKQRGKGENLTGCFKTTSTTLPWPGTLPPPHRLNGKEGEGRGNKEIPV